MPGINYNHLYYFYEVARHGSFTAASQALLVSQSALSVQVKALESDLGQPLFDRRRGGVELTEMGRRVFTVAEKSFQDFDTLLSEIKSADQVFEGAVSIATVNSIGIYQLPDVLSAYRERYPNVRVKITFREGEGVLDEVIKGRVDFALTSWNRRYPDLNGTQLKKNKMFLVAPPDHPLAGRTRISPRDLEAFPFVGYPEGMHARALMDSLFARMAISVDYGVESSNVATVKHMVMAGMGLGVVPDVAVAGELRRKQLVRLDVPSLILAQEIMLYVRKNRTLSRTHASFVAFLKDYFYPRRGR